jgi:hypothetical protein
MWYTDIAFLLDNVSGLRPAHLSVSDFRVCVCVCVSHFKTIFSNPMPPLKLLNVTSQLVTDRPKSDVTGRPHVYVVNNNAI